MDRIAELPRRGDWSQTFTGRKSYPLDPRPGDYVIEDIAHHLALECRFGGACRWHYSVAQHSVLGSYIVPSQHAFRFLFHDAAEAYAKDIPRPLKIALPAYKAIEKPIEAVILTDFGITGPEPPEIKEADLRMLATEYRDVMHWPPPEAWALEHAPADFRIDRWTPEQAEERFLGRFRELRARMSTPEAK